MRQTELLVHKPTEGKAGKKSPAAQTVDPNVQEAQKKLGRVLGTKVKIMQNPESGQGTIEISFYGTSDLDRIYRLINPPSQM